MNANARLDICCRQKFRRRAMHQIAGISRQRRIGTGKLNAALAPRKREPVKQVHRMKHRFQLVKTIRAPAQNVQEQIDLTGRLLLQRHARDLLAGAAEINNKKRANFRSARCSGETPVQSKIWKRLPGTNGATSPPLNPIYVSVAKTRSAKTFG